MPSALDLLAEWLAKGEDRSAEQYWHCGEWKCLVESLFPEISELGHGPTPDAAIRAAVEKARKI